MYITQRNNTIQRRFFITLNFIDESVNSELPFSADFMSLSDDTLTVM